MGTFDEHTWGDSASAITFAGKLHEVEIQLVARAAPGTAEAEAGAEMSRQ